MKRLITAQEIEAGDRFFHEDQHIWTAETDAKLTDEPGAVMVLVTYARDGGRGNQRVFDATTTIQVRRAS